MTNQQNELEKFQKEIDDKVSKLDDDAFFDGIINIEKYLNNSIKILWILKEPNSDEIGLDWRKYIRSLNDGSGNLGGFAKTFTNIIYITYGLLNKKTWNEINWIRNNPEIIEVIEEIAFINIKKTPGGRQSNDYELDMCYQKYKHIITDQITTFKPTVIICGNSFKFMKEEIKKIYPNLEFKKYVESSDLGILVSKKDNVVIFDARHPQNTSSTNEIYCNNILENYLSEQ